MHHQKSPILQSKMNRIQGNSDAKGKRIGIVVSQWNELITNALLEGALSTLESSGNPEVTVVQVPGTWEIPVIAQQLLDNHDGVIALGCILQGATTHAQLLAGDVGSALMRLQMETGKPITWGILTPETQEQALERAGLKLGNKGREAAGALVATLSCLDQLR
ncbi:6,7-dimethyl-8-ribityllumazine synthase [Armatimonadetes bacterium Uphvl-Ar1]|nr:6,7-dimethyl-8-ribityllumazine synthase [Armatimonadetes bacterium Uphvl-Ar1]